MRYVTPDEVVFDSEESNLQERFVTTSLRNLARNGRLVTREDATRPGYHEAVVLDFMGRRLVGYPIQERHYYILSEEVRNS